MLPFNNRPFGSRRIPATHVDFIQQQREITLCIYRSAPNPKAQSSSDQEPIGRILMIRLLGKLQDPVLRSTETQVDGEFLDTAADRLRRHGRLSIHKLMNPVEFADVRETMLIPDDCRSDIPSGRLAQLARAPRLQRGCRRFEPVIAHFWTTLSRRLPPVERLDG